MPSASQRRVEICLRVHEHGNDLAKMEAGEANTHNFGAPGRAQRGVVGAHE